MLVVTVSHFEHRKMKPEASGGFPGLIRPSRVCSADGNTHRLSLSLYNSLWLLIFSECICTFPIVSASTAAWFTDVGNDGREAQSAPEVSTLSTPTDTEVYRLGQREKTESSLCMSLGKRTVVNNQKEGSSLESSGSCTYFRCVASEKHLTPSRSSSTSKKIGWLHTDRNNCTPAV